MDPDQTCRVVLRFFKEVRVSKHYAKHDYHSTSIMVIISCVFYRVSETMKASPGVSLQNLRAMSSSL